MIKKQIEFNSDGGFEVCVRDYEQMTCTLEWKPFIKGDKLIVGLDVEDDTHYIFMLLDKGCVCINKELALLTDAPEESEDLPDLSNWGYNALPTAEEVAQAWTEGKTEKELSYSERVETRAVALSMKNQLIDLKK